MNQHLNGFRCVYFVRFWLAYFLMRYDLRFNSTCGRFKSKRNDHDNEQEGKKWNARPKTKPRRFDSLRIWLFIVALHFFFSFFSTLAFCLFFFWEFSTLFPDQQNRFRLDLSRVFFTCTTFESLATCCRSKIDGWRHKIDTFWMNEICVLVIFI